MRRGVFVIDSRTERWGVRLTIVKGGGKEGIRYTGRVAEAFTIVDMLGGFVKLHVGAVAVLHVVGVEDGRFRKIIIERFRS